jgi:hypothetical protein
MKRQMSIILLSVSLFLLAACGGSATTPSGETTAPTASSSAPVATTAPASSTEESDEDASNEGANEEATGREIRKIDDLSGSLNNLDSYHVVFSYSYKGTANNGENQEGMITFDQTIDHKNNRSHMSFKTSGEVGLGMGGLADMYQIDGMTYIVTNDDDNGLQCMSVGSDDSSSSMGAIFEPSSLVGGLQQAKLEARGETVNGIKADRYTFQEQGVGLGASTIASGEVWIAQDGEFVVKYIGKATSNHDLGLSSTELKDVTATWEYNVVDVNSTPSIEVPEACANSGFGSDVPVPANATDKASFGSLLTFASPDDVATLAEFYKSELSANGWTEESSSALGDMQILKYTKDNRSLSVTITKEDDGPGSRVMVSTSEE